MLDLIINMFFVKNKKSKLTVLKNRETCFKELPNERNSIIYNETTCLSKYFVNVKGLNVDERMAAFYSR